LRKHKKITPFNQVITKAPFFGGFWYNKTMKLYVFSDDILGDDELGSIAGYLHYHKKKFSKKKQRKISDDDIVDLAIALDLPVKKFEKIMRIKRKP
jgi:hypothetical protein